MRHLMGRRKLGRTTSHRIAMFKNMVTSLLRYEQIQTTDEKAKELRRIVERVITLTKRVTPDQIAGAPEEERQALLAARLHAVRLARRWVEDREVLEKIFAEFGTRFANRNGGYTRIVKVGNRPGDNAAVSVIQIIPAD